MPNNKKSKKKSVKKSHKIIFNDKRTDKTKPIPAEILEVLEMFKNGAFKTCDGKRFMINKELVMVYDYCLKEMNGMNMEWFNHAEKWVDTQMDRGLDTFDKMKCYWTREGAKKKNETWYGSTERTGKYIEVSGGMCVMAGAMMGLPPEEWASARDPLEMD